MPKVRMKSLRVPVDSLGRSPSSIDAAASPPEDSGIDFSGLPDQPQSEPLVTSESVPNTEIDFSGLPDKPSELENLYDNFKGRDPAEAAKVYGLSDKLNQPPDYVADNLKDIEKASSQPPPDYFKEIEKSYPNTAWFLSQGTNMAGVHDDIPNLVQTEQAHNWVTKAFDSTAASAKNAMLQEELGFMAYNEAFGNSGISPGEGPRLGGYLADQMGFSKDPAVRKEQIRQAIEKLTPQAEGGMLGKTGDLAVNLVSQLTSGLAYSTKYSVATGAIGLGAGLLTGPGAVASGTAGFAGGVAAGEAEYNFKLMAGSQLESLSQIKDANGKPLDPGIVKSLALINGAVVSGLSLVKLNALLKAVPGGDKLVSKFMAETSEKVIENTLTRGQALKNFATRILDSAIHGGGAFAGITATNIATEEVAKAQGDRNVYGPSSGEQNNQPRSLGQAAGEILTSAVEGAGATALVGIPLSSIGLIQERHQAIKIEQTKEFMNALGSSAEASKLRERQPEKYKAMISELTKDGPVENVLVPREAWDEYWQSKGKDPARVADELGIKDNYSETSATGDNVTVPMAEWTDKIVGTEHHQGLMDDIKFHQDDLTSNELSELQKETQKRVEEANNAKEQPPAAEELTPIQKIEQDVAAKATAAGRHENEGKHSGTLHGAYFGTLGDILGQDPYELYKKYDLQINNGQRNPLEPAFAQGKEPLGTFAINPETRKSTIELLRKANKSTLLHESGHLFLEATKDAFNILNDNGELSDKQSEFIKNSQELLKWLGVDKFEDVKKDQHEKFARGFEQYLQEGKAPSVGLKEAFRSFKRWLSKIYGNALDTGVELSPEVRDVFSRMLATDKEIKLAQESIAMDKSKVAEKVPREAKSILKLQEEARSKAEELLLKEQMPETTEEHKNFLKSERKRLTDNAEEQVKKQPVFAAQEEVRKTLGTRKEIEIAHKIIDGKQNIKEMQAFDNAATFYGGDTIPTGVELAKQMIIADRMKLYDSEVSRMVESGMAEHANLMDTNKIRERAMEVIHDDKSTELLALESHILSRLISQDPLLRKEISSRKMATARIEARVAKEAASKALEGKSTKEAGNFRKFITAERNSAVKAEKALERGDWRAAEKYKKEQLANHAMAAESIRLNKSLNKQIDALSKLGNRKTDLKNTPYGYVRHIDALLSGMGITEPKPEDIVTMQRVANEMLSRGEDPVDIANVTGQVKDENGAWQPESLRQFIDRVNTQNYAIELPESVYNLNGENYRELSVQNFNEIHDAIKLISQVGKDHNTFLSVDGQVDIRNEQMVFKKEVTDNLGVNAKYRKRIGSSEAGHIPDFVNKISAYPGGIIDSSVNLSAICKFLDTRWNPETKKFEIQKDGPAQRWIYRLVKSAEDNKIERTEKMQKDINALISKHYTREEFSGMKSEKRFIPEFGETLNKEELLSMAMNWGSEVNRERLSVGSGYDQSLIFSVLDRELDKRDWEFAQNTWDHLDTYYPESVELQMRTVGRQVVKKEKASFVTRHGEFDGGYYPIAYDEKKSVAAYKSAEEKAAEYRYRSVARAQTEQGRLKETASYVNRPLKLSLNVLFNHLEDTIHDLSFREASIDVNRFLSHKDVRDTIVGVLGPEGYRIIEKSLDRTIGRNAEDFGAIDRVVTKMKGITTSTALAFRIGALAPDFTGNLVNVAKYYFQREGTLAMSKTMTMFSDFIPFSESRQQAIDFIHDNSARMRNRALLKEKDVLGIQNRWLKQKSKVPWSEAFETYAYIFQMKADEAVSYPFWNRVYQDNVHEFGHEKAVHIADDAVTSHFGSSSKIDQSEIQNKWHGIFGSFYSWQNMMFNQAWLDGKIAGLEYDKRNLGNVAKILAGSTFFLWGAQSLQENFWKELFHNKKNDQDTFGGRMLNGDPNTMKRVLARTLVQPFGYIPILRDAASFVIEKGIEGNPNANFRLIPAEQTFENIVKPVWQAVKGDYDKIPESAAASAATLLKTPAQIQNMIYNYHDFLQGNGDLTWKDLINRRSKK